jgi:Na+-transporting NADH:ubiquinone oxidoreductase subunit NqrB
MTTDTIKEISLIGPDNTRHQSSGYEPKTNTPLQKVFGIDPRLIMPGLITVILLVGQLFYGILESYTMTLVAIASAIIVELALSRLLTGKFSFPASAYISGISVGILTRSPFLWPFAVCAALSISSKYVLRVGGRHIWNPSNFGICMMILLAPYAFSTLSIQWGNNLYAMAIIWTLGSIIIYRLKRFHIVMTYVPLFVVSAAVVTFWNNTSFLTNLSPITGPMYQLFIFFMITDPMTTVRRSKKTQCLVVFLIVAAETILRINENIHAPYFALFIIGPVANLVDIAWKKSEIK